MRVMFVVFLLFSSLPSAHSFTWVGHRGARSLYPENTTLGMLEALKHGVKTLELDVVISKDGEVVVSHEPWMNPDICVDPNGNPVEAKKNNFYKMTYAQIAAFDCGSKYYPEFPRQQKVVEHKPRLVDLIKKVDELAPNGVLPQYFIEIKSTEKLEEAGYQPSVGVFVDKVIAALEKSIDPKRIYIISLDWRTLRDLHKKRPTWKTVALANITISPKSIVRKLGFTPTVYAPKYTYFPKILINSFHRHGMKVIPWTVNSFHWMQKLINRGVDGIITDSPDLTSQARGRD